MTKKEKRISCCVSTVQYVPIRVNVVVVNVSVMKGIQEGELAGAKLLITYFLVIHIIPIDFLSYILMDIKFCFMANELLALGPQFTFFLTQIFDADHSYSRPHPLLLWLVRSFITSIGHGTHI